MGSATARPKRETDPAIKRSIDHYHQEFVARHGIKPKIEGAKHAALFRSMLAAWGEERVRQVTTDFVRGNDPWAVRCGWTVEALNTVAQRLLTRRNGSGGGDARTEDNLDAARRATQRRIGTGGAP